MASNEVYIDIDGVTINSLINWRHNPLTTIQRVALESSLSASNVGLFVFDTTLLQGFYWSGTSWVSSGGGGVSWGSITGALSAQTDLQNSLNLKANTSSLSAVAFSGSYSDLTGKPTVLSDFGNDVGFITGIDGADVISALGYIPVPPSILITAAGNGIQGGGSLAANRTINLDFTYLDSRYSGAGSGVLSFNARSGVVVPEVGDYSAFYYPLSDNPAGYLTSAILTADNGLTLVGSDVQLGGDITGNTTINVPSSISFELAGAGSGMFSFLPLPNGSTNITLYTAPDSSSNSSLLSITSTGIFMTLQGATTSTIIYLENNYIEIDAVEMVIASPLTIVDGSQGNAGDVWTSVDAGGDGHWQTLPVLSVFGRTGDIAASGGDYSAFYYPLGSNPEGYLTGITGGMVVSALGYTPYNSSNPSGYISGITGGMVTSALGYTPYNATNPAGYVNAAGAAAAAPVQSVAGKTGAVTLVKGDVGLGNVDNTSDINKPISTATQTALNNKLSQAQIMTRISIGF